MTSEGAHITNWKEEIGVEFDIPPGAVPEGKELELTVWPCSDGPFQLPDDYELASPVFLISPTFEFFHEINLTMYHFSNLEMEEDCDRMVFLSSPTTPNMKLASNKLAYQFRLLGKGVFKPHKNYGQFSLTHFCIIGAGRRKRKKQSSTPNSPPRKQLRGKKIDNNYYNVIPVNVPSSCADENQYVYKVYRDKEFEDTAIFSAFLDHKQFFTVRVCPLTLLLLSNFSLILGA